MNVSDRLAALMDAKGMTQAQLAERLGTSQPAISQWLRGLKTPGADRLSQLSVLFGVEEEWLASGNGKRPDFQIVKDQESYMSNVQWRFRKGPVDGGRDHGNANLWALKWDLETLVRETIQNSIDVPVDQMNGVGLEYRLVRLTGDRLDRFLTALNWNAPGAEGSLLSHLKSASSGEQKLATMLRSSLYEIGDRPKELVLLRVDDWGTTGLDGEEFDEGRFMALCRNNLDSHKPDGRVSGGSFGLGKAVLWRASRISTVLFRSDLYEPDDKGRSQARVFGKAELGWHGLDGMPFAGPGWFGEVDASQGDERTVSVWENHALADDLFLRRDLEAPFEDIGQSGTSILVVGFRDASVDDQKDLPSTADEIAGHIVRNFWPALEEGVLRAQVSIYENDHQVLARSVNVDDSVDVRPFVAALRDYRQGLSKSNSDDFNEPGTVISSPVELRIPRTKQQGEESHGDLVHEALLLIRNAQESDDARNNVNEIQYYRGRRMIVKREPLRYPGGQPFHAVVLCGEAAGDAPSNTAAERFLRTAEPPEHNAWTMNEDLQARYARGSGANLKRFFESVKERVQAIVKPPLEETSEGPEGLRALLRIGKEPVPRKSKPQVDFDGHVDDTGRWDIEGKITVLDGSSWRVRPVLKFNAESGAGQLAQWQFLDAFDPGQTSGDSILIPAGSRVVRFKAVSNPETHPVSAYDSAVVVELRDVKRLDEREG